MSNIIISDMSKKILEVKHAYEKYKCEFNIDDDAVNIVNNSGGKDSGATDLLAREILGGNYRSVAADTGNEHPSTIEHLKTLHHQRGGNEVEIVSADYSQDLFDSRKKNVIKTWSKKQSVKAGEYRGVVMPSLADANSKFADVWRVNAKRIGWGEFDTPLAAFEDAFVRSGNPFLDMCLLHGGFPMGRQRFCTDELKMNVVLTKVLQPSLDAGNQIIQWSGVRGDESEKRSTYSRFEEDKRCDSGDLFNFLPIHEWSASDVFALYKYFGINPNPLYSQGMGRVGCMPCILVKKDELAEISARFPGEIDRVARWEAQVAKTSRWIHWMIAGHVNRRQFGDISRTIQISMYKNAQNKKKRISIASSNDKDKKFMFGAIGSIFKVDHVPQNIFGAKILRPRDFAVDIERYNGTSMLGPRGGVIGGSVFDAVEWAKTGRGGKTYDLVTQAINPESCSSKYGLCG